MPTKISVYGNSIVGRVRKLNEDSFKYSSKKGQSGSLFVVCDGVGGRKAGEIASNYTSKKFIEYFFKSSQKDIIKRLRQTAKRVNKEIYDAASKDSSKEGMGTTLVVAFLFNDKLYIANVGDSRAYLQRDGLLKRLTMDNSVVENMVRNGTISSSEARNHSRKNEITRCIGYDSELKVDTYVCQLKEGDRIILCSDGLWDELEDSEITNIINETGNIQEAVNNLIKSANSKGGRDNITCLGFNYGKTSIKAPVGSGRKSLAVKVLSALFATLLLVLIAVILIERATINDLKEEILLFNNNSINTNVEDVNGEEFSEDMDNDQEGDQVINGFSTTIIPVIKGNPEAGNDLEFNYKEVIEKIDKSDFFIIRWYKNGVIAPEFDKLEKIAGTNIKADDVWRVGINTYNDSKCGHEIKSVPVIVVDKNLALLDTRIELPKSVKNYKQLFTVPSESKDISIGLLNDEGKISYCYRGDTEEGFKDIKFISEKVGLDDIANIFLNSRWQYDEDENTGFRICLHSDDGSIYELDEYWYKDSTESTDSVVVEVEDEHIDDTSIEGKEGTNRNEIECFIINLKDNFYQFYGIKNNKIIWETLSNTGTNANKGDVIPGLELIDIAKFNVENTEIIALLVKTEDGNELLFYKDDGSKGLKKITIDVIDLGNVGDVMAIESQYNEDNKLDDMLYIFYNNAIVRTFRFSNYEDDSCTAERENIYRLLIGDNHLEIKKPTDVYFATCKDVIYILPLNPNKDNQLFKADINNQ